MKGDLGSSLSGTGGGMWKEEGDREGWGCKCRREYWVRVVRFAEGERGWEEVERGESGSWEMV